MESTVDEKGGVTRPAKKLNADEFVELSKRNRNEMYKDRQTRIKHMKLFDD